MIETIVQIVRWENEYLNITINANNPINYRNINLI